MHQLVRPGPLGGQHLSRLRELREAHDGDVRVRHLKQSAYISPSLPDAVEPLTTRTVDAIVEERRQDREGVSTSTRLRNKVAAARRGIQTERIERGDGELQPTEKTRTTRRIAAVRRRGTTSSESDGRRRLGRQEAEWIEKQTQYKTRAATLERECSAAWRSFFAGAGSSSSSGFVTAAEVNKLREEMETSRAEDTQKMMHQLQVLSSKTNDVQVKVEEIANGDQFLSELQERIDAMETGLAKFKLAQRQQVEGYVLEEKMLEKELAVFLEKLHGLESETPPRLGRGGASSTSLGPKAIHLNSEAKFNAQSATFPRGGDKSTNDHGDDNCISSNQEEDTIVRPSSTDEVGMVKRVRRLNDAILRSGGLKGGWDAREHAAFTTLLVKCGLTDDVLLRQLFPEESNEVTTRSCNQKDEPDGSDYETRVSRLLRKCMRKVVTQTESSVRSHLDWYLRHLELVEEKKRVIQEWKARKEEERQQIIQCGFDADRGSLEFVDPNEPPEGNRDSSSRKQSKRRDVKSREKTERLLEQWKLDKKQKEEKEEQRRREFHKKRDALEAKRKQEQLDAKQKVLLYKLQKEQDATLLERTPKLRVQEGTDEDSSPLGPLPFSPPTSKEHLVERSRIAIEYAKAKRLRLQQIEERKQKEIQLPPRPQSKGFDESGTSTPKQAMVFNATEASKARDLSKDELRRKARRRERQRAHETYIPGKKVIPDVKVKSFGHLPIQPRAVPAWRKNI
ncbi:hypothetical protein PF005_g16919 [Phytophthora fragariae]|uniref:Coiled-coil domain-containing protein n=1 Tax=Phytophthora fragariae TaxID=53985 RepID=A0A6A3S634_9STRA|nr:hypothetical protein PF003_g16742 [Phytophthora fragariae]KAE8932072.1 hypothetical protein PF009_g17884 [Phytophthora fragariae]KAE8996404.1 hypothetical protein PF011_g15916 [Phytophthora fragariae]KAE9095572.1 hypothetical protein PF010_g16659 [Phytophthora fragariae]KAE9106480.1 hypothetical protein PF007_g13379 [Phytophthora fragariae]